MRNRIIYSISLVYAFVMLIAVSPAEAQNPRLQASNRQVQSVLNRIETNSDAFRREMQTVVDQGMVSADREERVMELVSAFEASTDTLRSRFDSREVMAGELEDLLNKAAAVDRFINRNRITGRAATQWVGIRGDLNTLASYYGMTWNWNRVDRPYGGGGGGIPVYTGTDTQLRALLARIENKTDIYKRQMERNLDRSNINNTNTEDNINAYISRFEEATDRLRDRFNSRQSTGADATEVMTRARFIDQVMAGSRVNRNATNQWNSIKMDLNTLAAYYRVSWNWNQVPVDTFPIGGGGIPVYTGTDMQLRSLLAQIENKTDIYKRQMDRNLDRSNINNTNTEDNINAYISRFEEATDRLRDRFNSRQSTGADATEVMTRARFIDQFMAGSRVNRAATTQWSSIRTDLDTLATYYRVSWNWNQTPIDTFPGGGGGSFGNIDRRLSGTFRLNTARSDNVAMAIDRAVGSLTVDQRDRTRRGLERRLASPEMIAIEKNGRSVSMASSNSPQVTFEADGTARSETNARGRTVTTTAVSNNNGLTINYEGDRMNDFYVTFAPAGRDQLNVTRRIYLEEGNETITVSSVYDRVDNGAQWSTVNTGGPVYSGGTTGGINDFYIPNGTRITATLRDSINTRASQAGDRFAMEVTSPGQYRGAIIEGRVTEAASSGRVTGRANVQLDFDTLRMNGQTYRFAGIIDSVTSVNGDSVSVNNEGTVRDGNRTTQTATRAGIGAVLGAIIGAVAGGGSGAAIGAGVGAGVGAGSVLVGGRDTIELGPGSSFMITATAPAGAGVIR